MARRALVLGLVLLALPAPAGAATLSLRYTNTLPADHGEAAIDLYSVRVTGTGADADAVTVDAKGRVRDDGPGLTAGEHCRVAADGWGRCTPPARRDRGYALTYDIATGDGDDSISVEDAPFRADLGAGDDTGRLIAAYGTVAGGPGVDRVTAIDEAGGSVRFDGGPGPDAGSGHALVMSYSRRTEGVRVTTDGVADDGAPGEGDDVAADVGRIEGGRGPDELWSAGAVVGGGPGDDHLAGLDSATNTLNGNAGDDVLDGGDGPDALSGGEGDDVLLGGPGDDGLDPGPGRDRIDGGPGDDQALDADADALPDDWRGGDGDDRWDGSDMLSHHVRVTLDGRANDGPPGEGDDVHADWESVSIARGTLIGSPHGERLEITLRGTLRGGRGPDVLVGGDEVFGGPGRDLLGPFPGARVDVRDDEPDAVLCDGPLRSLRRDSVDRTHGCYPKRSTSPSNCHKGLAASPAGVRTWKKPLTGCGPSPSAT